MSGAADTFKSMLSATLAKKTKGGKPLTAGQEKFFRGMRKVMMQARVKVVEDRLRELDIPYVKEQARRGGEGGRGEGRGCVCVGGGGGG